MATPWTISEDSRMGCGCHGFPLLRPSFLLLWVTGFSHTGHDGSHGSSRTNQSPSPGTGMQTLGERLFPAAATSLEICESGGGIK